jgi:hypothetical protein
LSWRGKRIKDPGKNDKQARNDRRKRITKNSIKEETMSSDRFIKMVDRGSNKINGLSGH